MMTNKEILDSMIEKQKKEKGPEPPTSKSTATYKHQEAYNLMQYKSEDGTEAEMLWNSRDGVIPFCIMSRNGLQKMFHVNWKGDVKLLNYIPNKGMRIFVTATPDLVRQEAIEYVNRYWDTGEYPMNQHPAFKDLGKDGAVEFIIKD